MNIVKIKIENLKPAEYNPRIDLKPENIEYQKIKRSLIEFGYVAPIIVNADMTVISGHLVKDDRIPNTLAAGSLFLRFDVPASISDRDIKLIQTFPQDYNFCGQQVQYICGMSVPPIMMKKIAKEIKVQLLDYLRK